jgi:tetratricopeptide (TPR) repeat protein
MANISLRAYNREIEDLIEQGQRLDEAVAHCLHILRSYPKHLETYRLLGKAYLEAKRYDQAVDIFQRVLVAAPEDFVSHVGMSIIADDQAKLDDAIWHMERAFEVQPSNAAIQAELQRLFGRRDGVEPPKIRLTRGALAHMYVQGELYTQAISEVRAVLGHDQHRTDMQVLLARAYSRNGQKAEAAEVCSALLAISPYCLDANKLMAELMPGAQDTEAAREYRRRVLELDPYAEFAKGSEFNTETVPDGAVTLQRLENIGGPTQLASPLGISLAAVGPARDNANMPPSWLSSPPAQTGGSPAPDEGRDDVPEFMREAGWQGTAAVAADVRSDLEGESPAETAATPGELPEWVRALAPSEELDEEIDTQPTQQETPDWLLESPAAGPGEADTSEGASSGDRTPDWLRELGMGSAESPAGAPEAPTLGEDANKGSRPAAASPQDAPPKDDNGLAWLEGLAEKQGAKPDELITDPTARPSSPPAWIDEAQQVPGAAPAGEEPADSRPDEKQFDWISGLSDQNTFVGMEEQADAEEAPILEERDAVRWPTAEQRPTVGEAPDWLGDSPIQIDEAAAETDRKSSGDSESAVDLPDWLAGLDREKPEPTLVTAPKPEPDELPDWLQGGDEPEPHAAVLDTAGWHTAEAGEASGLDDASLGSTAHTNPVTPSAESVVPMQIQAADQRPAPEPLPGPTKPIHDASGPVLPPLSRAQAELGRGNIGAALDLYGRLIRKGRSLEEIIRDLRDALYRYPVEVPIWQALGDAYMRANRLQEALDAYTKAEELLR